MERWDLIIVGAGPAGAAAALAARRARPSARVLLLDEADFPRDKACGDGVAAHAVDELAALGAAHAVNGFTAVPRLRIRAPGGGEVAGIARRPNWVVPRRVFDARLVEAAVAAGAVLQRVRVRSLAVDDGGVAVNGTLHTAVAVAADGANSTIRRLLGIPRNPPAALALAVRGYAPAPAGQPEQLIAMVRRDWPAYWWSFPIGDGSVNVGYGLVPRRRRISRDDLHRRLDELLSGPPPDPATLRAHRLPLSSRRPALTCGRVLLAGDAASLVNPLTGEGIFYAIASGRRAGTAAVVAADPAAVYRSEIKRLLGRHLRHTALLAAGMRHARLVDAGVAAASAHARVFDELVETGLGAGRLSVRSLLRTAAAYRV